MDWLGLAALTVAGVGATWMVIEPTRAANRWLILAGWWAALLILMWRFTTVDLRLREVARYTTDETPILLRVAGAWAGSNGSLLLWFTLVMTALAVATGLSFHGPDLQPDASGSAGAISWGSRRVVGVIGIAGVVAVGLVARPFARLSEPALRGSGLNPVLEHWAMMIHPPILYTGQALAIAACFLPRRRWTRLALGVMITATMLGSWWAHDEVGWGGFWAWDSVENTALAPIAALVASVHATSTGWARRWNRIAAAAVLFGIALTRSGVPKSVHAFASGGANSVVFVVGGVVAVIAALRLSSDAPTDASDSSFESPRNASPDAVPVAPDAPADALHVAPDAPADAVPVPPDAPTDALFGTRGSGSSHWWMPATLTPRVAAATTTSLVGLWTLVVIATSAIAALWLGTRTRPGSVDTGLIGRFAAPAGAMLIAGLLVFGFRRRYEVGVIAAHVLVIVFALGVVGTLASTESAGMISTVPDGRDASARINDRTVEFVSAHVDDSRSDTSVLRVDLRIDGRLVTSSIIDHRDMGRTRARPGRKATPFDETEVVVTMFDGEWALLIVRHHPGLPLVWLGGFGVGLLLTATAITSRTPNRHQRQIESG